MVFHQACNFLKQKRGEPQPPKEPAGCLGSCLAMIVKMGNAVLVYGLYQGLAAVMEQGRPTQNRKGRGMVQGAKAVAPAIVTVIKRLLAAAG